MYDLQYVKKRRRRKIAALVAAFSSIGVTFFIVTSFLGRTLGTFTVSLNNSEVNLALCEQKDSNKNSTYLRVNANSKYVEHSYEDFKGILETLDDETVESTVGEYAIPYYENGVMKTETGLEFFKYTFYVKNIGNKAATYEMKINISDRTRAKDASGRSLDDTLRVMVFENDPDTNNHDYLIYAKKSLINNYDICPYLKELESSMGDKGRIVVRYSGTEPLLRVLVEDENKENVEDICQKVVTFYKSKVKTC